MGSAVGSVVGSSIVDNIVGSIVRGVVATNCVETLLMARTGSIHLQVF